MIDWKIIYQELHLVEERGLIKQSREPRQAMLHEARKWPRGDLPDYSSEVHSEQKGLKIKLLPTFFRIINSNFAFFVPEKKQINNY